MPIHPYPMDSQASDVFYVKSSDLRLDIRFHPILSLQDDFPLSKSKTMFSLPTNERIKQKEPHNGFQKCEIMNKNIKVF